MIDLKLLTIKDLLPISTVALAQGVDPLSILITGDKLDQANEVYVNDTQSPEFIVLSSGKILAQVPTSERSSLLRKVAVVANVPSATRRSLLSFEVGVSLKTITGLEKLVQMFVKTLLQTPGTDRFRPTVGGGLLKIIGRNVSKGDTKSMQASVVGAVTRARDQILSLQKANRRIPADERLLTATADAVGFDAQTTTLTASISLAAVSGQQAVANITL